MRLNPAVFLLIAIVVIPAGQVCVARFGLNKRLREFVSDTWTRIALPGQRCEWSALGLHDEGQVALAMHLVRRHRARRADVAMVMLRHADLVLSELTVGFPDDKSATFYTNNRLRNVVWLMERVPVPRRSIMDWLQVIVFSPDAERTVLNEEWMPKVTDLLQDVPKRVPSRLLPLLYAAGLTGKEYAATRPAPDRQVLLMLAALRGYRVPA